MNMQTKMLVWNVRGWWSKKEEIKEKVKEYDIVILTETKSKKEQEIKIPGYKIITKNNYNNTLDGARGVTIIIREKMRNAEINEDIVTEDVDIDCAAIQIEQNKKKIDIIGIYIRPGKLTTKIHD